MRNVEKNHKLMNVTNPSTDLHSKTLSIRLADITMTFSGSDFRPLPDVYRPFITHRIHSHPKPSGSKGEGTGMMLIVKKGIPSPGGHRLVLDCETWKVFALPRRWLFTFHPDATTRKPAQVVIIDKHFSRGELFYNPVPRGTVRFPNPFVHPMLEVLFVPLLAQRQGILCHACGIVDNGKGFLFLGNSGDGKSTFAKLWQGRATILNDDRIIIRKKGNDYWIYGTPWHGDVELISAQGVPLEGIFFLKHGQTNRVVRKRGALAGAMFLSRSFLPLWNRTGMRQTIALSERIVASVPCYELSFVPDDSAVEFVRNLKV